MRHALPAMRPMRLQALAATTFAVALLAPATALAHSSYSKSDPPAATRVEAAPTSIRIQFTQPFNEELTRIELLDAATGIPYDVRMSSPEPRVAVIRPTAGALPTAPYRIRWHTVGGYDGHVLDGTFGFGVRTNAIDGEPRLTSSPFKGWGMPRVTFRAIMLIALFFFAGGVLVPALLRVPGGFAAWLLPREERGLENGAFLRRLERRTVFAGWVTVEAGVAATVVEAVDAGGSFSPSVFGAFLLTNVSGLSRLAMLALVAAAVLLIRRRLKVAAALVVLAFLAIGFGGHAYMPQWRYVAMTTNWVHLVAAAVWAGGIGQLALAWVPRVFSWSGSLRRAVMREVLNGFGHIALPAFAVVAVSGSLHALIRLGGLTALWQTTYGRVLLVKMMIVGLISLASYLHAMRVRPRLLRTIRSQPKLERHHWRLIGAEPILIAAAVAAVAVLVAFPLPPGQAKKSPARDAQPTQASVRAHPVRADAEGISRDAARPIARRRSSN